MSIDSFVTGVVMTATAATAATGGMVAGENQVVVTGDSEASVHITNVINAGDEGGTSHTEIIKTVDGNTTTEVKDKTFAPGEPIEVHTTAEAVSHGAASAIPTQATTSVDISEELRATSTVAAPASTTPLSLGDRAERVVQFISQLVQSVAGILFW